MYLQSPDITHSTGVDVTVISTSTIPLANTLNPNNTSAYPPMLVSCGALSDVIKLFRDKWLFAMAPQTKEVSKTHRALAKHPPIINNNYLQIANYILFDAVVIHRSYAVSNVTNFQ